MVKINQKREVIGYEVKITASVLNIREKPTTQSKIIGQIKKNATCTITELSSDKKWGKININSQFGWISLNYAKKI